MRHKYLCDYESFECDPENGFDTYIEHLDFDTEIQFFDATTVPLSGKIYIGRHEGGGGVIATGCPLVSLICSFNAGALYCQYILWQVFSLSFLT